MDDNTTTLTYDGINRLTAVTNPLGHTVNMTYDSRNNLLTFTDANGNVTRHNYDTSGSLISKINALGNKTRYKYDGEGRLIQVTDAFDHITKLDYDKKGRLTRIINPLGYSQRLSYDAADNLLKRFDALEQQVVSFDYDILNNPTEVTDALSNSSTFKYDELSRLTQTADPLKRVTHFGYNDLNRLISSVDALTGESSQGFDAEGNKVSLTDPNDNETQFAFDKSGRLVQESLATSDKVKYTYNARDLLESVTNGRNQQRQFEYDALGRLTRWIDPDGSISYTYDTNGNVLTVTDANSTIIREYDKLNRVTKYTDTRGNTLQYAYDKVGNLVTLTYPDGKQVHYEYDAADQLIKVTDWAQRVTSYDYDKNGRLKTRTNSNGTKMFKVYDTAGQLLQQKEIVIETGEVISQFDFEYDTAGNIIKEKAISEADIDINLEMTYAAANRLATYDDSGVQLDADGNMISGPLSGDIGSFVFDSRNRLTNAGETVYHYDVENQRIGVNQTQYVVNSQPALSQVLVKTEVDGTQTYYVYGLGLIGQEQNGEYLSYHFDFRGSTVALTDENAQITEQFQYSPYGLLLSGDASITPFLFNGKYGVMTDSNGLYYMRARYYHPEMRRFVNQDVLRGRVAEGQTLNRYAYVNGDPIKYTDPYGLDRLCGGGERAVPCPDQPGVYNCVKDSKEPMKVCGGRNDEYGCLSKDAPHGGNTEGPRPFTGLGGFLDVHLVFWGITVEETIISEGRKYCKFAVQCGSIGPGIFGGSGVNVPLGMSMDDIEASLAGKSAGLSFDFGCLAVEGWNVSVGYDKDGITSAGSAKGFTRTGGGCGLSLTLDLCDAEIEYCGYLPIR